MEFTILEIDYFSLESHSGEYSSWPIKSKLFKDGAYIGEKLNGYCIECQFKLKNDYYFLIISYDCPFEEQCDLILLNREYKQVANQSLVPYIFTSWNYDSYKYVDINKLVLTFNGNYYLSVSLYPDKFFKMKRIQTREMNP